MTTIFHKDCGGTLLIDVQAGMSTLCDFSVQKTGLRLERLLLNKKTNKIPSVFNCQSCDSVGLSVDDVQVLCSYCSKGFDDPKDINYYPIIGGFYCTKCVKAHLKDKDVIGKKRITSVLSNISLTSAKRRM